MKQNRDTTNFKNWFQKQSFLQIVKNLFSFPFILVIYCYQKCISPLLPPTCRFYPTCSQYAKEAFIKYGAIKGFWLSIRRIGKCHPFNKGGYDPVP